MSPRARIALAALSAFASLAGGTAVADAVRPLDADEAPLAALALALAAAPVPQQGIPEPGAEAATREPRVELATTFAARSVVFDELPRIRMTFGRPGPVRLAWRVERKNLPARVEAGVVYRDVEVRLTLSSTVDEFESLIDDARRVVGGLRVDDADAPEAASAPPVQRTHAALRIDRAARPRMDAINAARARAGLLPRKSPPGVPAPGAVQPVPRTMNPPPAPPAALALSQAEPAAPAPSRHAVPAAAPDRPVPEPAAASVFRLADVVLASVRSRLPAGDADAAAGSVADTSVETLRARVRGALVESLLVGRVGELTIAVQTGSAESSGEMVAAAASAAPVLAAPTPPAAPVLAAASAAPVLAAPTPPAAPVLAAAPATVPRSEPSRRAEEPGLLSRWKTDRGEVVERTLDPSGRVVQRQVDPPDGGWERAIDVSRLTLVSQRRDDGGGIVQVVQDVSGAYIEVTRDPIGRFLHARVLRR